MQAEHVQEDGEVSFEEAIHAPFKSQEQQPITLHHPLQRQENTDHLKSSMAPAEEKGEKGVEESLWIKDHVGSSQWAVQEDER